MSPSPTATATARPLDLHTSDAPTWGLSRAELIAPPPPSHDPAGSASFSVPGLPGSFCMYYLPELDLRSGTIATCEALLRWQHPSFGLLRPGVTLEGTRWHRQLPDIEEQALDQVCGQIASWGEVPVGQVAVNVSAARLADPGFLTSLDRSLVDSGIDPTKLAIDLPMEVVAIDPSLARRTAEELVDRGIGVAIDGVGGIPSHHVLCRIPASAWKIDLRVDSARNRGIHPSVANALAEAREVGVGTTAKAVEDLDLLQAVRDLGFDRAFGYAISPAVDAAAVRGVVERGAIHGRPLFGAPARPTSSCD